MTTTQRWVNPAWLVGACVERRKWDDPEVSDYRVFPSPVRDPVFDAGKTSRINVADFMARLITDDGLWTAWKGQMPVVYNASSVD